MPNSQHATAPTAKVYKEICANCGHEVSFDAMHIHRENPYWPWLEQKDVQDLKAVMQTLAKCVSELNETIRVPQKGLIAQIGELVGEFRRLLGPERPTPPDSEAKGSEA